MTLQEAIRIIAEYDGQEIETDERYMPHTDFKYHKSADALLPVYRKAYADWIKLWLEKENTNFRVVIHFIVLDNLAEACIELAHIIQQLNEKK
jgi:hypothetical protein